MSLGNTFFQIFFMAKMSLREETELFTSNTLVYSLKIMSDKKLENK